MCSSYKVIGLDDNSILSSILEGTDLPLRKLDEYSPAECSRILLLALKMIRSMILENSGFSGLDQEAMDQLLFKAGKDSATSSMRPSSDFFGNRTATPKDSPDEIENPAAAEEGHNTDPDQSAEPAREADESANNAEAASDGPDSTGSTEEKEKAEADAEAALRRDHHRSLRNPSGRKPGKQKGAKGHGFKMPDKIDRTETVIVVPEECKSCPHREECLKDASLGQGHSVYDVEFRIIRRIFKPATVVCPQKEEAPSYTAEYPGEAAGPNQYGASIKAHVVLNFMVGMVAYLRNAEMTFPTLGLGSLSPATIRRYVHELAELVHPSVDRILDAERGVKCVHCDETGGNVNGKIHWIHCIATSLYTYVAAQEKRGKEGMDAIGFLEDYVGTVVHDCWSSYWKYEQCQHAVCNEHIERELQGLNKFFQNADKWAGQMIELLQKMLQAKHEAMNQGMKELPAEMRKHFSDRFDELISLAEELHPVQAQAPGKRGRKKKGRARALVDRMKQRKAEIFRFIEDFDIPYSNNTAEQAFRMFAVRRSVGIFRTFEGMKDFCCVWSYISSARKHGVNYYDAVTRAFAGDSIAVLFPD